MEPNNSHTQKHLDKTDTINLGSYYTPPKIVGYAYDLLKKAFTSSQNPYERFADYTLLDNSCGYGEFLKFETPNRKIGADIDQRAIENLNLAQKYVVNALNNPSRTNYGIKGDEKLIVVGNPPYNDVTSQIKRESKRLGFTIDDDLKARDIGVSFLRSYVKLDPDYICVLHPLSYLIKKANFNLLKEFTKNYRLVDGLVVSSKYFTKGMEFPLIVALYKRGSMDFSHINNFAFIDEDGLTFRLVDFDFIGNYLNKYPRKKVQSPAGYFYTMRDINALKRNRTFLEKHCANAITIEKEELPYYHYVNLFKIYAKELPFWCGNLDVFIDNDFFKKNINEFVESSTSGKVTRIVDDYFRRMKNEARKPRPNKER